MKLQPYLIAHVGWSTKTFGSGPRPHGLVKHIRKELLEILKKPDDLKEWVDVMILAIDGATRAGHSPDAICKALIDKQGENIGRAWQPVREGQPCEHVRKPAKKTKPKNT
jgi:hypothetical protein